MATHSTPRPDNTALVAISSTLEVANPEAQGQSEFQQWAEEGLAKLTPLFDAHNSLITKEQGLQSQLAENRNAIVKMTFDIGACLIEIKASLPKNPGRFGSTGWEYFTAQTMRTFGLDCGTASKYMSIAKSGALRTLLAENAYNGEGFTTLYELSRIGSQNFAEIKRKKYLTAGGERLPHSKAEAWRKECDVSKKPAKPRAAQVQGRPESARQKAIIPGDVTPPVGADPTAGEQLCEVQTGDAAAQNRSKYQIPITATSAVYQDPPIVPSFSEPAEDITLAGRFTTGESAPVTRAKGPEQVVYFYPPRGCAERQLEVMQKRLELNFKQFQEDFPESDGYYFIVKLTLEKPDDSE